MTVELSEQGMAIAAAIREKVSDSRLRKELEKPITIWLTYRLHLDGYQLSDESTHDRLIWEKGNERIICEANPNL